MELQGKRAAVLVEQQYQEMEVWYPVYRLREAGCKVTLVGPEAGQSYPSKLGYPAKSDKAAKDVSAKDFDLLVIPGGFAPDYLRRHESVLRLVSDMAEQGKIVAAVCHGPWVLCSTQALKGKKATCFSAIKDDVSNAGARYVDEEVVRDGNLITSRKPDDLPAFMQTIVQAVREAKTAVAAGRRFGGGVCRGAGESQGVRPVLPDPAALPDRGDRGRRRRRAPSAGLVAGLAAFAHETGEPGAATAPQAVRRGPRRDALDITGGGAGKRHGGLFCPALVRARKPARNKRSLLLNRVR